MPGYGTPLSLTLPTINGVATEAQAAPLINTALSAVIARLESKVGAADIDVNADVSFKSGAVYSGITNLQRAAFRNLTASLTAATNPSTVYVLNGDLHYIDAAGNLVQITSGGQVNVSTTGGITGAGYGTSGVEVNFDSVNGQYRLRDGSATDSYADAVLADVLFNDGSGNFIRMQAPAMSADYTMTLPSAVPASTSLLQMTSAGLVQNTRNPSVDTLAAVTGTFLGVTSLNLTSGAVTVSTNGHVTVSGTGLYKRGSIARTVPACAGGTVGTPTVNSLNGSVVFGSLSDRLAIGFEVGTDEHVSEVSARVIPASLGVITLEVYTVDTAGTETLRGSAASVGTSSQLLTVALDLTTPSGVVARLVGSGTAVSGTVLRASITTDVP